MGALSGPSPGLVVFLQLALAIYSDAEPSLQSDFISCTTRVSVMIVLQELTPRSQPFLASFLVLG